MKFGTQLRDWGRMVKFSHSLFALPFAFSGAALAAAEVGITWPQLFWIVVAMIGARNAGMGFNRLVDQRFDAANPRTAQRELPLGKLGRPAVWLFTIALTLLFLVASNELGVLRLAPIALLVVFGYSYTKRFTWASHLVLGAALGLAPLAAYVVIRGEASLTAWLLAIAVLLWVAGFDVVYSCQDIEFDRESGLFSIPARFGIRGALIIARLLHGSAVAALAAIGIVADLHPVYWIGWTVILVILIREHRIVRADDLSKVGVAFFNLNAAVSAIYLANVIAAVLMQR
jgi:4-hydroxybenzoate polyprenyltransferase